MTNVALNHSVTEIIPQHQTVERLLAHPKAQNILEFLADVLDVDRDREFYPALFKWSSRLFHDQLVTALLNCPDGRIELVERVAVDNVFISELIKENAEGLAEQLAELPSEIPAFLNEKFLKSILTEYMDELSTVLVTIPNAVSHLSELEPIQNEVMLADIEKVLPCDKLINEVVKRYYDFTKSHEVRQWVNDVQLNNPSALCRR